MGENPIWRAAGLSDTLQRPPPTPIADTAVEPRERRW